MRLDLGTLDQLCGQRFRREACRAAAVVRADPGMAERTARSLGL
jgi:phage tail protein X